MKGTMKMTTPRENLLRVFRHERPAWIPVAGHCDPYNQPNREGMDPELAAALGDVRWGDTSTVVFSRALGLDIMDWFGMPAVRVSRRNVVVESRTEGDVTRMDAVHAFTVPPTGNVTVAEGRRLLGDRITIMAGTGPILSGSMADRDAVRTAVHKLTYKSDWKGLCT